MYIYHNKDLDEYLSFSNLTKLSNATGLNYDMLANVFSRKKELRYDGSNFVIVRFKN